MMISRNSSGDDLFIICICSVFSKRVAQLVMSKANFWTMCGITDVPG